MNEVQRQAIARAEDHMRPGLELYDHRSKLFHLACTLALPELKRVCRVLEALTPDEVSELLAYAEGLAAWRLPAQESGDAPPTPPLTGLTQGDR